ncbi:MAG: carbamoyltransferase HypF [Syntrophaceae bacterium]
MDYGAYRAIQDKDCVIRRVRYQFSGIVQGVGFRPFIYRLATGGGLAGSVCNSTQGVVVEVEGPDRAIEGFLSRVRSQTPPLAEIYEIHQAELPLTGEEGFRIIESSLAGQANVPISPDIATCDECLKELFDPSDRRYRYPFINCTNCGPRLTIIHDIPYDRTRTSMAVFPLCEKCRQEYEDPADRRFHAEPNACSVCGPRLTMLDASGKALDSADPLSEAIARLEAGAILAIKGLGGFHLCVDAGNDEAVRRLRRQKFREEKPLAVMVRDLAAARRIACVSGPEEELLSSPARPIVLLQARPPCRVSGRVAPRMSTLGIMLPYTPLHHLLLQGNFPALVMTSANKTDEPICISSDEAVTRLSGIAEGFLVHNRDILVRCDDSVSMVTRSRPYLLRRSRGYAPRPLLLKSALPEVLAVGPHLKSTVCITKGGFAFLSPHIGDLETPMARDFLHETIGRMQHIVQVKPDVVACDLHPRYYSTRVASQLGAREVIGVQHHHAHIVSCMAENRIEGKVIGMAMDGTGFGEDGRIWGGEFFVADETGFTRAGHLKYLALPGGEAAIRQPWRIALSLVREAFGSGWKGTASRLGITPEGISVDSMEKILETGVNSPLCSSLGRLFDGVASIVGLERSVSFEGQAAMGLEAAAGPDSGDILPYEIRSGGDSLVLDPAAFVRAIVQGKQGGADTSLLASSFHRTLVAAFTDMALRIQAHTGLGRVVLSGGCFQNRILLEGCVADLERAGLEVFTHQRVPANDGGVSLGQAVVAGTRMMRNRRTA